MINPEEMFEDLIRFREELGAALPEDKFTVTLESREDIMPGCFVVYEPNQTKKSSKYHFMSCSELKRTCELGHAKTLRITNDISGLFRMYDGSVKRLPVCKTCLKEAGLRAETLSIREFFRERNYESQIGQDILAQIWMGVIEGIYRNDRYGKHWDDTVSPAHRELTGHCEICGASESLITHHINMYKPDTRRDNLIVLCRSCHAAIHRALEKIIAGNSPTLKGKKTLHNYNRIIERRNEFVTGKC